MNLYGEPSERNIDNGQERAQTRDDTELVRDKEEAEEMAYAEKPAREAAGALLELAEQYNNPMAKEISEDLGKEALSYLKRGEENAEEAREKWEKETKEIVSGIKNIVRLLYDTSEKVNRQGGIEKIDITSALPRAMQTGGRAYRILRDSLGLKETHCRWVSHKTPETPEETVLCVTRFSKVTIRETKKDNDTRVVLTAYVFSPRMYEEEETRIREAEAKYLETLPSETQAT